MSALTDHLWQSLLCFALLSALAWLTRHNAAQVRLWLWRLAAAKLLLPFAILGAIGAWWEFPVRFAGDPPPASIVELVGKVSPWFSAGAWFESRAVTIALLITLLVAAVAAARWSLWCIHHEALRARREELRLEADPDDRERSVGFFSAAALTACAMIVAAVPFLGGAVRASVHAHELLEANTQSMNEARVTLRPAQQGLGSRYFVNVDSQGVLLRNVTVRELTGMAYGVNRFFVRGKHFREGDEEDWLVDSRHDVRIDAPVIEPDNFDTYALRNVITRELATNFGLEIYVNSECQKPCGKWGDRVLLQVTPDSWKLVSKEEAKAQSEKSNALTRSAQPARSQLRSFLAAFNSGDGEILTRYLAEHVSAQWLQKPGADEVLMMLKQTGGFEVLELEDIGPNSLKGWVRARDSDALMALSFYVESEPPHRVSGYSIGWGNPPKQYFPARLSEAAAVNALRAEAAGRGAAEKFSGALLLARGSKVLVRGAYGLADRDARVENRPDTRFRVASLTKMFTAVAVLRLVQQGKIELGDTIGTRVPELAGKPIARATIHQLLTHTSGAGDVFGPRLSLNHQGLRTLADFVKMFGGDPLVAEPGRRYQYSNLGYLLLGRMIEQVSGRSYYDYVRDVVFLPAGMSRSGFEPEDAKIDRAEPYERPAGTDMWVAARYQLGYRGNSASQAYSTVDDLHRFVLALRANQLLNAKYTGLMLASQYEVWKGNDYGYGVMMQSYEWTGRWLGYAGVYPGTEAQLWFSPDTGYLVIALSNMDPPAARHLADFATARLPLGAK